MHGRMAWARRIAILGGIAVLLTGCGASKTSGTGRLAGGVSPSPVAGAASGAPGATPTSTATGGTTSVPTSGSTMPPGGGSHTTAPASHPYPSDYPGAILSAWASHDNAFVALLTSTGTANTIRGYGNINTHWTLVVSEGAAGSTYATYYNNAGDLIIIRVSNEATSGHQWHAASVQKWDPMTFPSSASAYAKKYVDGWISGNKARMNLLGTTALTSYLEGKTTPTVDYALAAPFSTSADEVEVEVTDTTTSLDISLIIDTTKLGHQHAIGGCDIGC